jgi:RHS repeat-associated protein
VQELVGGSVSANLLLGLDIDESFRRTDAGGSRDLLADGLGSTLALTDAAGIVRTDYTYDAFGGTTANGSANSNSQQFTGRENDGTGLYYYRARYYAPGTETFIAEDPIQPMNGASGWLAPA